MKVEGKGESQEVWARGGRRFRGSEIGRLVRGLEEGGRWVKGLEMGRREEGSKMGSGYEM